jgi:hypothetical protein
MKAAIVSDRNLAISFSPQQFVDKVGHRDIAVARELKAPEDIHWAGNRLAAPVAGDAVVEKAVEIVQHRRRAKSGGLQ